jgi:plastocyanin
MRKLRLALPVAGSALLVVVAACGATGTAAAPAGPAPATPAQTHAMPTQSATGQGSPAQGGSPAQNGGQTDAVAIRNFAFAPAMMTVPVGTTITWTNDDQDAHTVSATGGAFKSAALNNGDTFRFTFSKPGRYDYICSIHPFMTATVVVTP